MGNDSHCQVVGVPCFDKMAVKCHEGETETLDSSTVWDSLGVPQLFGAFALPYWHHDNNDVWECCMYVTVPNRQLSDVNRDGALSLDEFCTAMHLVVLRRNDIELPDTLPPVLQPYTPLVSSGSCYELLLQTVICILYIVS